MNFKVKRYFFLFGKKKYIRADHAHLKCSQIIIPINGKIKITTYRKNRKKIYILSRFKKEDYLFQI